MALPRPDESPEIHARQIRADFDTAHSLEDWHHVIGHIPWLLGRLEQLTGELTKTAGERNVAYRECAHLVALIAAIYPSCWNTDPGWPDWRIIYVDSPAGQLSWHISAAALVLFPHVMHNPAAVWDGHTTDQKYQRVTDIRTFIDAQHRGEEAKTHRIVWTIQQLKGLGPIDLESADRLILMLQEPIDPTKYIAAPEDWREGAENHG
jgi:hypothetical protein